MKKENANSIPLYILRHSSSANNAVTTAVGQGATLHFLGTLKVFFKNLPCIKTFISKIK